MIRWDYQKKKNHQKKEKNISQLRKMLSLLLLFMCCNFIFADKKRQWKVPIWKIISSSSLSLWIRKRYIWILRWLSETSAVGSESGAPPLTGGWCRSWASMAMIFWKHTGVLHLHIFGKNTVFCYKIVLILLFYFIKFARMHFRGARYETITSNQ